MDAMTQTLTRTRPSVARADLAEAAQRRGASLANLRQARRDLTGLVSEVPVSIARSWLDFPAKLLHNSVNYNGQQLSRLRGIASVTGIEYEMWDMFGPYMESIRPTAFDVTLSKGPDVTFLMNHEGVTMARTLVMQPGKEPTLILGMVDGPNPTDNGLGVTAYVNPKRSDVALMLSAIDDGLITEMSFRFMIDEGWWSEDFMHFEIAQVDIDRGDVSGVNFGANPYTSIASRQRELLDQVRMMPLPTVAGVLRTLAARSDVDIEGAMRTFRGGRVNDPDVAEPVTRDAVAIAVNIGEDEDEDDELECPACGAMNEEDALFCDQCGASLEGVEPTSGAPAGAGAANAQTAPADTRGAEGLSITHVRAMFIDDLA